MSIMSCEAPGDTGSTRAPHGSSRRSVPLYIVCSPRRSVGKTLLSRLLTEFYVIDGRPVAAFDLADEEPQLADYLPRQTILGDIGDTGGQMDFFERLLADHEAAKIVDVSHRVFKNFFIVVQQIGFFEEARRRSIEPVILFMIDSDPRSAKAYGILRHWFAKTSLLPVRNQLVAKGIPYCDAFPNESGIRVSLEIPLLGSSLRTLIDQQSFSFARFWRTTPVRLPARLDDELRAWMKRAFVQFRELQLCLMCEEILSSLESQLQAVAGPGSREP
jgi:hypothetical protein